MAIYLNGIELSIQLPNDKKRREDLYRALTIIFPDFPFTIKKLKNDERTRLTSEYLNREMEEFLQTLKP